MSLIEKQPVSLTKEEYETIAKLAKQLTSKWKEFIFEFYYNNIRYRLQTFITK